MECIIVLFLYYVEKCSSSKTPRKYYNQITTSSGSTSKGS